MCVLPMWARADLIPQDGPHRRIRSLTGEHPLNRHAAAPPAFQFAPQVFGASRARAWPKARSTVSPAFRAQ